MMRSKTFKLCIPQVSSQAFRFCKYFFLCGLKKHLCVRSNWWKAIIEGEESKEVLPRSMRKQQKFSSFNFFFTFPKCCQDATSSGNKCLPDVALGCYAATPTISFVTCLCNPRSRLPLYLSAVRSTFVRLQLQLSGYVPAAPHNRPCKEPS